MMATYVITSPDGKQSFEVTAPDSASPDEVMAYAAKNMRTPAQTPGFDPTEGNSFLENVAIGGGKALTDIYRGGKQILGVGDQAQLQREVDEAKRLDAPIMLTGGGIVGNLAGNIAATAVPGGLVAKGALAIPRLGAALEALLAARPVASAIGAGAGTGAAAGALEPVATGDSRVSNAAIGAGLGAAGGALPGVLSRVVKPQLGADEQALLNAGVRLTPGQVMGGMFKRAEDAATSLPVIGDFIKGAQSRTLADFNRAGFNRALAPIGERVAPNFNIGREGVAAVEAKIGAAYDRVLDKIKRVDIDDGFSEEVGKIVGMIPELGEQAASQFGAILKNRVFDKITEAGTMSAETMKSVESELGRQASRFTSSADANQRGLGSALREVQASLRRNVQRSAGPELAGELQNANTAWANFTRLQDASGRVGAAEGVFTPAHLLSAVRSQDKSVRKGAFTRGDALMQDLADSGKNVLPSSVPDSGTASRLLTGGGLLAAGHFLEPTTLGLGALGMGAYAGPGRSLLRALITKRPEGAATLADILRYGAMPGGVTAGATAPLLAWPQQ